MRYVRIFFLNLSQIFEIKSKTFVYFLLSLIAPAMFLLFWVGAKITRNSNFNFSAIASYYLLFVIMSSFLMCHMENDIGMVDIQEGNLVKYLLKPFSYFWSRFLEEISYRVLQTSMGIILLVIFVVFLGSFFSMTKSPIILFFSIIIAGFALFLSYTYKVILGLLAFWLTDINGIFQLSEMLLYVFAGYVVPLYIFPKALETVAYILPFSYMIYFPVVAIQGRLDILQCMEVILIQIIWLVILLGIYRFTWRKGREKFLAVGQ